MAWTRHKKLSGVRFGRLIANERVGTSACGSAMWSCLCDCGTKAIVRSGQLRGGITNSCGCLQQEVKQQFVQDRRKHGRYTDRAYINEISARRRAAKRRAFVEPVDHAAVYERDMGLCQICGLPVESDDFHLDHRMPLSRGGEHSYANCQTAHAICNRKKMRRLPEQCGHLWMR